MMPKKWTESSIRVMVKLRDKGASWPMLAQAFNSTEVVCYGMYRRYKRSLDKLSNTSTD